jgi:hypothetical protein
VITNPKGVNGGRKEPINEISCLIEDSLRWRKCHGGEGGGGGREVETRVRKDVCATCLAETRYGCRLQSPGFCQSIESLRHGIYQLIRYHLLRNKQIVLLLDTSCSYRPERPFLIDNARLGQLEMEAPDEVGHMICKRPSLGLSI